MASAAPPTAQAVTQALHTLLRSVDFGTTTERMIRDMLAGQLGDVSQHVDLIRSEIESYLSNIRTEPAPVHVPQRGTKRKVEDAPAAGDEGPVKFAKSDDKYRLSLGSKKYLTVGSFKGKTYVGIREYYEKDGQLHPGGKGTNMPPELWAAFTAAIPALEAALQQDNTDYALDLSDTKRVTVVNSGRVVALDVREWYKKPDGEPAPTKKGVRFDEAALQLIKEHLAEVADAVGAATTTTSNKTQPAASTSKPQPAASTSKPQPAASTSKPQSSSQPAAASTSGAGQAGEITVELGNKKRLRVTEFKGRTYVDFREFYEKDGNMLPGQKGIMLQPAEWDKLRGGLNAIQQALAAKDTTFFLPLTDKRRAAVSEYRNSFYVSVREYYEKDGEMLPGKKGLTMNPDQWAVAVASFPKVDAVVQAAKS